MKVTDIMTKEVATLDPEATIDVAAKLMRDWNVGVIPVCENRKLVGVVTDRDIAVRAVAAELDSLTQPVQQIMTDRICFCFDSQSVKEAAGIMEREQLHRLPVVNEEKHLVGIISLGDIAVKGHNRALSAEALEEISKPSRPAA